MEVFFDEASHTYSIKIPGGFRTILGVTTALRIAGLVEDAWFTPEAAERGKLVHLATCYSDDGELDEASLDERILPYVYAWQRFREDTGAIVLAKETVVVDRAGRYAGTFDRLLQYPGSTRKTLIDIKTGAPQPWHHIQTAAYAYCLDEPVFRESVYIDKDGDYKRESHPDRNDEIVWQACLTLALWKEAK